MTLHFAPALDTHSSGFSHVALASSEEMNSLSKAAMRKSEFTQSDMSCNKPFLAKNRTWFVQILIFVTFVSSLTSFAIPRSPWDASPSKLQDVQHYEGSQENGGFRIGISLQKGYYWYDSFGRESSPTWRLFFKQVGGRWNMKYESIHSDVWFLSMYNPWLLLVHKDQQRLVKFTTSSNLISDALNSKSLMTVLWFSWLLVQSLTICTMDLLWKRHHLIRFLTKVHISTSKMLQEHTHTHIHFTI